MEDKKVQLNEKEPRADFVIKDASLSGNTLTVLADFGYPPVVDRVVLDISNRSNYIGYGYTTKGMQVKVAQAFCNEFHRRVATGIIVIPGSKFIQTDGIYGSATQAQVKVIQKKSNITQDGIVGPATWRELYNWFK